MATLKANGDVLVEFVVARQETDGADGDPMVQTVTRTIRAMSSGYVLARTIVVSDYATGGEPARHNCGWRRVGKIRPALLTDRSALVSAMEQWLAGYAARGWDVERA